MDLKDKLIIVLMGASGVGKSYIASKLPYVKQVTTTTRDKRINEEEGKDYNFISREDFNKDDFIEYDEYLGNYYGLPKKALEETLSKTDIVTVILTERGCKELKKLYGNKVIGVLVTSTIDCIFSRLRGRGDSEEQIKNEIYNILDNNLLYGDSKVVDYTYTNIGNVKKAVEFIKNIVQEHKE